jgi:alpha-D-ribose 1-methylphosphonate 5-triphosphate synthase subunit PhnH
VSSHNLSIQNLNPGFADPVHDAQGVFRCVLNALSRPGRVFTLGEHAGAGAAGASTLGSAMAQVLLCLTDDDTPVWWQQPDTEAAGWLRFHTGAPVAQTSNAAAFAVLSRSLDHPALASFAVGTADAPEHSATLLLDVPSLESGPAVEWCGPGISGVQTVCIAGLPDDFWTQWQANHAAFPQGVDIVFTCGDTVLGLPRTTRVRRLEGL